MERYITIDDKIQLDEMFKNIGNLIKNLDEDFKNCHQILYIDRISLNEIKITYRQDQEPFFDVRALIDVLRDLLSQDDYAVGSDGNCLVIHDRNDFDDLFPFHFYTIPTSIEEAFDQLIWLLPQFDCDIERLRQNYFLQRVKHISRDLEQGRYDMDDIP